MTVRLGSAPSQLNANSMNLSYVFVIDTQNLLYQLVLYFDIFQNIFIFQSICNTINLPNLNITGISRIEVGLTGQYIGLYNGTMYIFQYTLPYIDGVIENAVVF